MLSSWRQSTQPQPIQTPPRQCASAVHTGRRLHEPACHPDHNRDITTQSPKGSQLMPKSKFFRVAVEGGTTDGRTITREWIEQ
ncbi:MAG: GPO family capsid scaffolding protein, partial [Aeromonadaceae bacterium]